MNPTLPYRFEFLGKLALPLLRMENGRKRWYALKDKKMRCRAKGSSSSSSSSGANANPQILLEFELHWNRARAAIRTLNPKEDRYMTTAEKFKRQVGRNNLDVNTVCCCTFAELLTYLYFRSF